VRNTGTRGSTEVQHFAAGLHVDVVHTTEDTGCQLRAEGVPDTVFDFCCCCGIAVDGDGAVGSLDGDALLAVGGFALS